MGEVGVKRPGTIRSLMVVSWHRGSGGLGGSSWSTEGEVGVVDREEEDAVNNGWKRVGEL